MKKFTFYFVDGRIEEEFGYSADEVWIRLGYEEEGVPFLDYYEEEEVP